MSPLYEPSADEPPAPGVTVPVTVDDHQRCPATALLRRIGDKWSPVLLSLLAERGHGFNELDRSVQGLSRRMLVRTLRSLERDGLISRTLHPGTPPRTEYALTDLGRSLRELLNSLGHWAVAHEAELLAARAEYDAASWVAEGSVTAPASPLHSTAKPPSAQLSTATAPPDAPAPVRRAGRGPIPASRNQSEVISSVTAL